ncbi:MAG: hypothetical protein ACR2QW_13160 [bacterium]
MKHTIVNMLGLQALVVMMLVGLSQNALSAQHQSFVSIEKERGLPMRGQTSASVRQRFGEPQSTKPAVGKPPISSWDYPGFIVYFERDLVITTVAEDDRLPVGLGAIQ